MQLTKNGDWINPYTINDIYMQWDNDLYSVIVATNSTKKIILGSLSLENATKLRDELAELVNRETYRRSCPMGKGGVR